MKKLVIYLFSMILGASIPIYFFIIYEPLKSEETISNNVIDIEAEENKIINETYILEEGIIGEIDVLEDNSNTSNSVYDYLSNIEKEEIETIMRKLSILDLVRINNYFSDKSDTEKVEKGLEIIKKRMNSSDYNICKDIFKKYIESDILN